MTEKNPYFASTFAERKAIREGRQPKAAEPESKQVDVESEAVEDKAVTPSRAPRRRATKKS